MPPDASNQVECNGMPPQDLDFEKLVELHYQALYRFAFSLTRNASEAGDLTQQSFYILAKNGGQLRDRTKAKSWLFTTCHREYLGRRRRIVRFPETDFEQAEPELPAIAPRLESADAPALLEALAKVDPSFQAAVSLFYLEDYSYPQIAEILEIPLGTVKSRISRGIGQLQRLLVEKQPATAGRGA
jgi:RNA polymerase sigma factor (sigma-70 family)